MFTEINDKVINLINVQSIKKTETLNEDGSVKTYDNTLTFQNGVKMLKSYQTESERDNDYTKMSEAGGSGGGSAGMHYVIVQTLPATGEEGTIYLTRKAKSKQKNVFDENIWVNNDWELIGDTEIDLSNYLQEEDLKTINGNSIVGSGDLEITGNTYLITLPVSKMQANQSFYKNDYPELYETLQKAIDDYFAGKLSIVELYWVGDNRETTSMLSYNPTNLIDAGGNVWNYNRDKVGSFRGILYPRWVPEINVFEFYTYPRLEKNSRNDLGYTMLINTGSYISIRLNAETKQITNPYLQISDANGNGISFISPGVNYTTPYTPQYDGSPANKKYVDDTTLLKAYQLAGLSEYSSSSTYAVGDYVYYNNLIYKCSTAVDTAEDFDSTKWDEKTYMQYMSDILIGSALNNSY